MRRDLDDGERLCEDPQIVVFDGLLTAGECEHIIAVARPLLGRAQVSGATLGETSAGRTSARAWLKHETDPVVHGAASRIAEKVGLALVHAESLQVIHYEAGQEYRPHFDAYDLSTAKGQRYCERGGQRLVTALAYLSPVDGGATGFPRLGLEVRPQAGRVLIFNNCRPNTSTRDPRSYHQGMPPRSGDKWAFNLWFHERPYWP